MALDAILEKNRDRIIKKWFDHAVNTYPLDTSRFLKTQANEFANPVGAMLLKGMAVMFDELVKGPDQEKIVPVLDPIARVRAIQDFTPSNALSFILHLKPIVRQTLRKDLKNSKGKLDEDLIDFFRKVDDLLLLAFDIYTACREKIFDLKANEEKNKVYKAFRRAGLITESLDDDSGTQETNGIND